MLIHVLPLCLANEQTLIVSPEGRAFLLPREDLRPIGEMFARSLALIIKCYSLARVSRGLIFSRERTKARTEALIMMALLATNLRI